MTTRPLYETAQDLRNEERIKQRIEEMYHALLYKLPIRYELDYLATRHGKAVAWIEVKTRNMDWGQYPSIVLSLEKWLTGKRLAQETGIPFVLMIMDRLRDVYQLVRNPQDYFSMPDPEICWGGRTKKKRDSADEEPVVYLPCEWFTKLKGENDE